ncbi:Spermidine/putrescine import ATP-binding protein PotA [bioreactor metagenome]|uniref:Spermidine/putrescine import ATP-binding protein PotA n=1 Tax=bioreactor metagenome TaxID=1076179 RepID=A0A645ETI7_9ZZZZ
MKEDYKASFSRHVFQCLDKGFAPGEKVDVVIRPEDVIVTDAEAGMIKGTVTSVTFKGVHFEIIVDIGGFKWMVQSTREQKVNDIIGLQIVPDAIHIMRKSEYSGKFGDYSSFSDEIDHLSDLDETEE